MDYMSITQTAIKWGISRKRVQVFCINGRIPGAQRVGKYWAIPADADKPDDMRRRRAGQTDEGNTPDSQAGNGDD